MFNKLLQINKSYLFWAVKPKWKRKREKRETEIEGERKGQGGHGGEKREQHRGKEGEVEGKIKGEGKGEKGVEEVKEGEGRGKMFWKESGRRSLYDEGWPICKSSEVKLYHDFLHGFQSLWKCIIL